MSRHENWRVLYFRLREENRMLKDKIEELEDKIEEYEWVLGIGEEDHGRCR